MHIGVLSPGYCVRRAMNNFEMEKHTDIITIEERIVTFDGIGR